MVGWADFAQHKANAGVIDMTPFAFDGIRPALNEVAVFALDDLVRVASRSPIGHYRVPTYLRGCLGKVVRVIEPAMIDNEEEGYGRNAGNRRHYYRVAFAMTELWPEYGGPANDVLEIEIFETWLERA
jgi:nitrile hydratase